MIRSTRPLISRKKTTGFDRSVTALRWQTTIATVSSRIQAPPHLDRILDRSLAGRRIRDGLLVLGALLLAELRRLKAVLCEERVKTLVAPLAFEITVGGV